MVKIKYESIPEFKKDFKKLSKRYRTLPEDLNVLKKASIEAFHIHKLDSSSIFAIQGYCDTKLKSYKVKKLASRSLKGKGARSGLRLIYIYIENQNKIVFIEIYYKGDKPNEDKNRLKKYYAYYKKN